MSTTVLSVSWVDEAGSSMDLARAYDGGQGFPHWVMVRRQSKARGRMGRRWLSPLGAFTGTLILAPKCPPAMAALYSFVAAAALRRALTDFVPPDRLSQKWPNDVLLDGRKVAGILLEAMGGMHVDRLSIGIGVNLSHGPDQVDGAILPPIGMRDVLGAAPDLQTFLTHLHHAFFALQDVFLTQGFGPIRDEWLAHAAHLGNTITARTARETLTGRFDGIDDAGNLILLTSVGPVAIPAADVYF